LHAFEAVIFQTLVAWQSLESGPDSVGTQVDEVIEIEIDAEAGCGSGAIVKKARIDAIQNSS
jgi:hypothetical protein